MKKILHLVIVLSLALSQACEGPAGEQGEPGPKGDTGAQGPAGPQGPAGTPMSGTVYDFSGWTFTAEDDTLGIDFAASEIEVAESDIILVYRLVGGYAGGDGNPVGVWKPLPETIILKEGLLKYDYLHSFEFLLIMLQAQFPLVSPTHDDYLNDQLFRIVIIPGQAGQRLANGAKRKFDPKDLPVDINNYEEVIKYYRLSDTNVRKIQVK